MVREMERLATAIDRLREDGVEERERLSDKLSDMRVEIAMLKVKSGSIGGVIGGAVAGTIAVLDRFMG